MLKIQSRQSMGKYWTEKAVHFEPHTFLIFRILARPVAFTSAWLDMEIHMTWRHAGENLRASHTTNSILEFVINFQLNVDTLKQN